MRGFTSTLMMVLAAVLIVISVPFMAIAKTLAAASVWLAQTAKEHRSERKEDTE